MGFVVLILCSKFSLTVIMNFFAGPREPNLARGFEFDIDVLVDPSGSFKNVQSVSKCNSSIFKMGIALVDASLASSDQMGKRFEGRL